MNDVRTLTAPLAGVLAALLAVLNWTAPRLAAPVEQRAPLVSRRPTPGTAGVSTPLFVSYPSAIGGRGGETSIGVNPKTNATMFLMSLTTARVEWDDTQSPPAATWTNVSYPLTSRISLDPILWTDRVTGRTFVVQLAGEHSIVAFTDDDGVTWVPGDPPSAAPAFDHQTVGGGPYAGHVENPVYPNVLYYCAQLLMGECANSFDGGLTWSPPHPMNVGRCISLHGHVVVDAEGSAYVPHGACTDAANSRRGQAVIVSDDNGVTWERRLVPGMLARADASFGDPSIAFDRGGRLYFANGSAGRAMVTFSDDGGKKWGQLTDVGEAFGIRNVQFPMMVAGDAGRAAFAFYGTTTEGNDQSAEFTGEWHVYVAFTYDGGATWETHDVTPGDPVQRGCIWLRGGGNPCRNLLDFQGATVDAEGRVLIGYADGCISEVCLGPQATPQDSRDSLGTIARLTGGRRLYSAFD